MRWPRPKLGFFWELHYCSGIGIGVVVYVVAAVFDYTQSYLLIEALIIGASLWAFSQDPTDREIATLPRAEKICSGWRFEKGQKFSIL